MQGAPLRSRFSILLNSKHLSRTKEFIAVGMSSNDMDVAKDALSEQPDVVHRTLFQHPCRHTRHRCHTSKDLLAASQHIPHRGPDAAHLISSGIEVSI